MSAKITFCFVLVLGILNAALAYSPTPRPKCLKPNEKYDCGSACQNECATLGEICPIVNVKCNEGCYCIDGYARDINKVCIPEKQCPPKKPTPPPTTSTKYH